MYVCNLYTGILQPTVQRLLPPFYGFVVIHKTKKQQTTKALQTEKQPSLIYSTLPFKGPILMESGLKK